MAKTKKVKLVLRGSRIRKPLTEEQVFRMTKEGKDPRIAVVVGLDLEQDIIGCDSEQFLNNISAAVLGDDCLSDFTYKPIEFKQNKLWFYVDGDATFKIDNYKERLADESAPARAELHCPRQPEGTREVD